MHLLMYVKWRPFRRSASVTDAPLRGCRSPSGMILMEAPIT